MVFRGQEKRSTQLPNNRNPPMAKKWLKKLKKRIDKERRAYGKYCIGRDMAAGDRFPVQPRKEKPNA